VRGYFKNRGHIFALIIFLVALALRLVYALPQPATHWDEDEIVYLTIARNLVEGDGLILTPYRKAAFPPLYPLFLAGLLRTGISIFPAARVIQSILGAVSCLLLMGITRMVFSIEKKTGTIDVGIIAAGFMAIYPVLIFYCVRLMTETIFILLIQMSIFSLLKSLRSFHRFGWLGFGGVMMGLGVLCRPTLLPFSVLVFVWLFIAPIDNKQIIKRVSFFFVPFILVILLWTVRNYRVLGEVVPVTSSGGANLYLANNISSTGGTTGYRELMKAGVFHLGEDEDEIEYNRYYRNKAFSFIENNPGEFIRLAFKRLLWFYHLDYHYRGNIVLVILLHLILVLAVIGAWISRCHWRKTILLGMVIFNFTVVHMIFLPEGRYRLPLVPFLLVFAAIPIFQAVKYFSLTANHANLHSTKHFK
jgi:4-amino-4-deoxy-L-arabinose transferase-like glycosyltransferase